MHAKLLQSCPTLCDSMDCSPPGSSVHEILQARILEWVAMPFSRGSSPPRDQTQSPALQADSLSSEQPGKRPPPKVPNDPAIPLLGIYHEKITIQKDICTSMFTAALFTIARKWKQPRCLSTDEWIKKLWYFTHTHTHTHTQWNIQFSSVTQLCPTLCDTMNCSTPGLPVRSLLKLISIESVMLSSHLILCRPLLLLPPIPPSIRVFSNESTLRMRWPMYWSFSFSISPSNEHPGLISFRMDWLDLLAVQGALKNPLQQHSSKASNYSAIKRNKFESSEVDEPRACYTVKSEKNKYCILMHIYTI